jgi:hypothetical protein
MKNLSENYINQETERAIAEFCPFHYSDLKAATTAALEAGKTSDYVYEQTQEFAEICGMQIDKCDPVYCVYDSILQEARNEIEELIKYDFENDFSGNGEGIYVFGNFLDTHYFGEEGKDELKAKLQKAKIKMEDLSEVTQWFLHNCQIEEI